MRALLLPIKDLKEAKQRLAGVLTPEERFGLVQAMLVDTFRAIRNVTRAEKIFVATSDESAIRMAQENGWEILREERQISESDSVDSASCICESRGVSGLLRLPLDIPLVPGQRHKCHALNTAYAVPVAFWCRKLREARSRSRKYWSSGDHSKQSAPGNRCGRRD